LFIPCPVSGGGVSAGCQGEEERNELELMTTSLLLLTAGGCWGGTIAAGLDGEVLTGILLVFAATGLLGVIAGQHQPQRVRAGQEQDASGHPQVYTLRYGDETVRLEPGKPWHKIDTFKWTTRGLIEEPQSLHISSNGAVEINSERITLDDPEGIAKLELEINKHHPPSIAHHPPTISRASSESEPGASRKVRFKVRLDHLGHLMMEAFRGSEHIETGLRGLQGLVESGFLLPLKTFHVDPLQRAVEIDGTRFECTEVGARQLQETLNTQYAPELQPEDRHLILIKENAASATGFDIEFIAMHAGGRLTVKGHLSQERLNLLQDPTRCDLLRQGIILRLSPPYLLVRRRLPNGGEERIPELPDTHYLRTTAGDLQQLLNHNLVRRSEPALDPQQNVSVTPGGELPRLFELRLVRNRQNRLFLWLEGHYTQGKTSDGRAFTHHNVADLQQRGAFHPHFDVSLSLDNRHLSILNKETAEEQLITVDQESCEEDLARAGQWLTRVLASGEPHDRVPSLAGTMAGQMPHLGAQGPQGTDVPPRVTGHA
jgi:hypothetical protein